MNFIIFFLNLKIFVLINYRHDSITSKITLQKSEVYARTNLTYFWKYNFYFQAAFTWVFLIPKIGMSNF